MRNMIKFARRQRAQMSCPEKMLWERLRGRRPDRPVIRRQHPMGRYVLDFYCMDAWLAIEVDGWHHTLPDRIERDATRDAWLASKGIDVLRIPIAQIQSDPSAVADRIWALVIERGRILRSASELYAVVR